MHTLFHSLCFHSSSPLSSAPPHSVPFSTLSPILPTPPPPAPCPTHRRPSHSSPFYPCTSPVVSIVPSIADSICLSSDAAQDLLQLPNTFLRAHLLFHQLAQVWPYRQLVGALMYAMVCTRPDIAQAVSGPSRWMKNPHPKNPYAQSGDPGTPSGAPESCACDHVL